VHTHKYSPISWSSIINSPLIVIIIIILQGYICGLFKQFLLLIRILAHNDLPYRLLEHEMPILADSFVSLR